MVIKNISTSSILDKNVVMVQLGYGDRTPPEMVSMCIDEQIEYARQWMRPIYSFHFRGVENISFPDFQIEGGLTFSSKVVSYVLDGCEKVAVYLATLGKEMDKEITRLFSKKETLAATVLDIIGSTAINQTLKHLRDDVGLNAGKMGLESTRHYAPGYCDWDLSQHRILFKVLDYSDMGVSLNNACMMTPRKSVSGIIGIGNIDNNKKAPCGLFCKKSATCEYRNM